MTGFCTNMSNSSHGLSDDFLRLQDGPGPMEQRAMVNVQRANMQRAAAPPVVFYGEQRPQMQEMVIQEPSYGAITVGLKEAALKKKPGMFKNDVYCRIKHAGVVINGRTVSKGGRNPSFEEEYIL